MHLRIKGAGTKDLGMLGGGVVTRRWNHKNGNSMEFYVRRELLMEAGVPGVFTLYFFTGVVLKVHVLVFKERGGVW